MHAPLLNCLHSLRDLKLGLDRWSDPRDSEAVATDQDSHSVAAFTQRVTGIKIRPYVHSCCFISNYYVQLDVCLAQSTIKTLLVFSKQSMT